MKVSIVIPAYNEEAEIAGAIQAALAQDYPDLEIIVVDNASTDRTAAIASGFPVKVVSEPRKGLLWARECGRLAASGDIIANMDADCIPDPSWVSRGVGCFSDPAVVGTTGPYDYHDSGRFFRWASLATQKHVYSFMSRFLQSRLLKKGAVLIGGNNMIRAGVLVKAGGYTTSITFYGEDTDTAKKVSRFGRIAFNPDFYIRTSARRFKAEGTLRLMLKYWYHFFKHILK